MALTLKIGRRHEIEEIENLEEASRLYQEYRDASEEGASTFPDGKVTGGYKISYNGRVWKDGVVVQEAAKVTRRP